MDADRESALTSHAGKERIASCGCGGLKAAISGEPSDIYVCSCEVCQQRSGGAFTYAAIFPEADVTVTGESRSWRRKAQSGRWIENSFCPTCGSQVFAHISDEIGINLGAFDAPDQFTPTYELWAIRREGWLPEFPGMRRYDRNRESEGRTEET